MPSEKCWPSISSADQCMGERLGVSSVERLPDATGIDADHRHGAGEC